MAAALEEYVDQIVNVISCDGRVIVGLLRGFDQMTNVILEQSHERVYSPDAGVEQVELGLYIIRGDNVAVIGHLDEDIDVDIDWSKVQAEPLKPVVH